MGMETPMSAVQIIGRYHIVGEVGRGGMGIVYQAEDPLIGRRVAIKTLTEVTPELRERFYIEARSGILSHQNIVTIYELGEHEGNPFIAMEFIDGESLEHILRVKKRLPTLAGISIVEQLCSGLGYAHEHGVVHRDIKPANILIRPDGRVTLVDFGIARLADQTRQLTKTDTVLGTFHYIAPERLKGEISDGRSDIWSAGVILYQVITGKLPFRGSDLSSLYRIIHEPFVPLAEHLQESPEGLSHVLDRALAKDVEERYATAEEMASDLRKLADGLKLHRMGNIPMEHASSNERVIEPRKSDPAKAKGVSAEATVVPQEERRAPKSRPDRPQKTSAKYIRAGALAVLVSVIAMFGIRHRHPSAPAEPPVVSSRLPSTPTAVVSLTYVYVNASPWAKVIGMKDSDGKSVALPPGDQVTPLRLENVKLGNYQVLFESSDGEQRTADCKVSGDSHSCSVEFKMPNVKQLLIGDQQ